MSPPHLPAVISAAIQSSIEDAVAAGDLDVAIPAAVPLRRAELGRGHFASNVALTLGAARARDVARVVAHRLRATPGIADVEVAGPGFLNVTVDDAELAGVARAIVHDHESGNGNGNGNGNESGNSSRLGAEPEAELDQELVEEVQFAHGRLCSLATQAAAHGVTRSVFTPELLGDDTELALLTALADPDAAPADDPPRLLAHLADVARTFQTCFAATRLTPRGAGPVTDLHRTRLWLAEATRIVLANGLRRLGLTAPEHI